MDDELDLISDLAGGVTAIAVAVYAPNFIAASSFDASASPSRWVFVASRAMYLKSIAR